MGPEHDVERLSNDMHDWAERFQVVEKTRKYLVDTEVSFLNANY